MSAPDLKHLLSPDVNALPETPRETVLEKQFQILPGGGIRVSQDDDSAMITAQPQSVSTGGGDITVFDPLATVSFRTTVSTVDGVQFVNVVTSYVNDMFYQEQRWFFEQFTIPAESVILLGTPRLLYLKFPVMFIAATTRSIISDFPAQEYQSGPQVITGADYIFNTFQTTGYVTRRRGYTPASYYELVEELPAGANDLSPVDGGSVGFWYFLIASIGAGGVTNQWHLGSMTLPQSYQFNILDITITP